MAWRWARPRTTTDDDEDAIHLAFSTDRGGYKRWQAISSGTRRRGPPRHRGVRGKRSPARPSLVGTSQPPSRRPQRSYDACASRRTKRVFQGNFFAQARRRARARPTPRAATRPSWITPVRSSPTARSSTTTGRTRWRNHNIKTTNRPRASSGPRRPRPRPRGGARRAGCATP